MVLKLKLPNVKLVDATHTTMLRESYRKKLQGLFNKFDNELKPGLMRMLDRNVELATVKKGFLKEFSDKLNTTADATIYAGAPKVINDSIKNSYSIGKKRASKNPRLNTIKIDPQLSIYDMRAIEDLNTRNLGLVTKMTEDMKANLLGIMTDGIKQGMGTNEIAKNISNQIGIDSARAKTIARTEIAYSYNTAISETYQKAGISQWQWLATLGYYCCDICQENHGQVFDWGDPEPPEHPNCLCTIYPVVEGA